MVWQRLYPLDILLSVGKRVCYAIDTVVNSQPLLMLGIRDAPDLAIVFAAPEPTGDYHRLLVVRPYRLYVFQFDRLHIGRVPAAMPSVTSAAEFLRLEVVSIEIEMAVHQMTQEVICIYAIFSVYV